MSISNDKFPENWFSALKNGDLDKMRYISRHICVDINDLLDCQGDTSLIIAAVRQQYHVCRFLVDELGASVSATNKIGRTALIEMVRCRSNKWSKDFALLFRTSVNDKDNQGQTALMYASTGAGVFGSNRGNITIIKYLLNMGADITITDRNGYTALGHAYRSNSKSRTQNNTKAIEFLENEYIYTTAMKKFHEIYSFSFNQEGSIMLSRNSSQKKR